MSHPARRLAVALALVAITAGPAAIAQRSPEPESALTERAAVEEVRALANRLVASGGLSGALLVAKGPEVLVTAVGGEANRSFHVPNTLDTRFNLGSMNKMFTTTAAARLVEKGKLSFDDPISLYVDESWLPKAVTDQITVRHLATHTSGLGSYFNERFRQSSRELFRQLDDFKTLVRDDRPAFPPGQRFAYSNTGMLLLGVVIEKASSEDYFEWVRKAIYAPAGMTDTDCYEMDYAVEKVAIGYSYDRASPHRWRNNLYAHVLKGGPAGGGFSTVGDLHRFALAMLGGTLVSASTRELMWTDAAGGAYGYGFQVRRSPAGKVVGHSGGFPGINSRLDIYLDAGWIVAVMSNVDDGASPVADAIARILARAPSSRHRVARAGTSRP